MHSISFLPFLPFLTLITPVLSQGPLWSQVPINSSGWEFGNISEPNGTYFCNYTQVSSSPTTLIPLLPQGCSFSPPKATSWAQITGFNPGPRGYYWMAINPELPTYTSSIDNNPRDYVIELLDFGVQRTDNNLITDRPSTNSDRPTSWQPEYYVYFNIALDTRWEGPAVSLLDLTPGTFTTFTQKFYNHTGTPWQIWLRYTTGYNNGTQIKVVFSGVRLYWI